MGFKADQSFLRFLSMGAAGVHQTIHCLRDAGFEPIELERYCATNKIWATKYKRDRLPDLLCIKTGLRVEVKAKSDLQIKLSDSPKNPDRIWEAGLRSEDVMAFIACKDAGHGPVAAETPNFFSVHTLKASEKKSKLGVPKSHGEGAEVDRVWSAIVPKRDCEIVEVTNTAIKVRIFGGKLPGRNQTYSLGDKHSYVSVGDVIVGGAAFIAGLPKSKKDLNDFLKQRYNPGLELLSDVAMDRYAAAKALPHLLKPSKVALKHLEKLVRAEEEPRVRLEAAGSAAALDLVAGKDFIVDLLSNSEAANDEKMEAVLMATEHRTKFNHGLLLKLAGDRSLHTELRQAAVWGLGLSGHKSYEDIIEFIGDSDDAVAMHAILAIGPELSKGVTTQLLAKLGDANSRFAPAASEVLSRANPNAVIHILAQAAVASLPGKLDWIVATLGRMDQALVSRALAGNRSLLDAVAPVSRLFGSGNWLASKPTTNAFMFLAEQRTFATQ